MKLIKSTELKKNQTYLMNIFTGLKFPEYTEKDARLYATYLGEKNIKDNDEDFLGEDVYFFLVSPIKTPMEDEIFTKLSAAEKFDPDSIKQNDKPQLICISDQSIYDAKHFTRENALEWFPDRTLVVFYEYNENLHKKLQKSISKKLKENVPEPIVENIFSFVSKKGGRRTRKNKKI